MKQWCVVLIGGMLFLSSQIAEAISREPVSPDETVFDLTATPIVALSAEKGFSRYCQFEEIRTETGFLGHCFATVREQDFLVRDRVAFVRFLEEAGLGSAEGRLLPQRAFDQGEGLYTLVERADALCVAFYINTGRKRRTFNSPRTEELIYGLHCAPFSAGIEGAEKRLLSEVDEVRIRN